MRLQLHAIEGEWKGFKEEEGTRGMEGMKGMEEGRYGDVKDELLHLIRCNLHANKIIS